MEHLINANVKDLQISGIRRFFNMVNEYEDVVSLTIGQPDFSTPEHVKQAGIDAIRQNQTTYTHNAGIFSLRQAIADRAQAKLNVSYQPEEVIVTVGASQAIDVTLRTIIQPGDEIILPAPVYPGYEPLIKLAGGVPVHVDTTESHFKLNAEALSHAITSKTKAIIMPYPSNPTGVTLSSDELSEIASLLRNQEIFLLADEIYSELVYDQPHVSLAQFPDMKDKVIVINGVSKSHAMTGWRIGYLLAPHWLTRHILKVHQYNVSCASSISQYAALEAIQNGEDDPIKMREIYKQRRDYVLERLQTMGITYTTPGGAFYVFPFLQVLGKTSTELAVDLVDQAGVALVPGDAFTEYGQGYMRLSYAYDMNTLQQALDRLEAYI
ncbi:aminotransferase A [Thalassobacillus sp. CUG 92003]|uniref:aminotransferase A n=1 Tax=Thalassobacillus sp. CUG 92003 TaxID=2736641 RepID=UPI0015E6F1FC|nr:aminotransferase A [Thalassobacillus sp. CUG 92003]